MADDEFALRKAMERATQAQQILENPLWPEAVAAVREMYIDLWEKTRASDTVGREQLWWARQALPLVQKHLETALANGKVASAQIERDFRPPKRFGIV